MLCTFQLLVYLSGDVSNLNAPTLCDNDISMTHIILYNMWTQLGICTTHHRHALSLLKAGNHTHNFSSDTPDVPYTYTNW